MMTADWPIYKIECAKFPFYFVDVMAIAISFNLCVCSRINYRHVLHLRVSYPKLLRVEGQLTVSKAYDIISAASQIEDN